MFMRSIAEFVVAVAKQGPNWEKGWETLRPKLGQFLRQLYTDEGTIFLDAIIKEAEEVSVTVISELNSLLPAIEAHRLNTVPTECRDGVDRGAWQRTHWSDC